MDVGVDLAALQAWMDEQGLGSGPLEAVQRLSGGTQNILLRFTRAGRDYVLRRPPPVLRANSNETMRREARALAALAGTGVPHPGLIAACPDETVIGAAFYLMEPIDGFNATQGLPVLHAGDAAMRGRMGLAMVDAPVSGGTAAADGGTLTFMVGPPLIGLTSDAAGIAAAALGEAQLLAVGEDADMRELAQQEHLLLVCGSYEGYDERVRTEIIDQRLVDPRMHVRPNPDDIQRAAKDVKAPSATPAATMSEATKK